MSRRPKVDVLINNAGVSSGLPQLALGTSLSISKEVVETNVFEVIEVTQAFIGLLRQSPAPRIVNATSGWPS